MSTIQGQSTSNASSISQRAATVALNGDQTCVVEMNKAFEERHDFVVAGLNAIPGISCLPGAGTFYAFADVHGAMRKLWHARTTPRLPRYLLVEGGVAVVPGSGFGAGTYADLLCLRPEDPRGCARAHPPRRHHGRARKAGLMPARAQLPHPAATHGRPWRHGRP